MSQEKKTYTAEEVQQIVNKALAERQPVACTQQPPVMYYPQVVAMPQPASSQSSGFWDTLCSPSEWHPAAQVAGGVAAAGGLFALGVFAGKRWF